MSLPAPCSTKGWRARAPNSAHTHSSMPHCYASPATNQLPMPEPRTPRDPPESTDSSPLRVPPFALGSRSPPHTDPCPLSLVHSHMLCTSLPCEMEDSLLLNICSRMPCRPRPEALAASAPSHCGHPHSCHCQPPSLEALLAVEGGQRAARAPFRSPHHLIHKGCGGPTPHATATTLTHLPPLLPPPNTNVQPNKVI